VETPLDWNAKLRVRVAFLLLFIFIAGLAVGAYYIGDLRKFQDSVALRETQAALEGIADPDQLDRALKRRPSNKILQLITMATKAAAERRAATDAMLSTIEPASVSKPIDWGTVTRNDLEALGRDLKLAEANATAFMPRYLDLLKAERSKVEKYAASLHVEGDMHAKFFKQLDERYAKAAAAVSRLLAARGEFYRSYGSYVAVMAGEFGAYKVVNGQFVFPFQRTVDRYNVASHAMTAAAKRVAELEEERNSRAQLQQEGWEHLVDSQ
jgi:hypothetical protein